MREKELQLTAVKAMLTIPDEKSGKKPAVLIISGSGPVDYNGNTKKFASNVYRDLAAVFTEMGYVTLRYDKRNLDAFYKTTLTDLIQDAKEAFHALQNQPEVDDKQLFIAGHSEGAMIATIIAEELHAIGLILLAGAGQNLIEATEYQRERAYKEISAQGGFKGWLFQKLKVIEKDRQKADNLFKRFKEAKEDVVRVQLVRMNAAWWREHMVVNMHHYYEKLSIPILAITGSKDVQADPNALQVLKPYPTIETVIIKDMNHVLKIQTEEPSMMKLLKQYKQTFSQPIAPELCDVMGSWLTKQIQGRKSHE